MPHTSEKREARSEKKKTGFTLIELMIAVSIIAIISAIGLVSYSQTQLIARDAKRKADLRSVAVALELYNQTNKRYPCSGDAQVFLSTTAGFWIADSISQGNCSNSETLTPLNSSYINIMPKDPKNTGNPDSASSYGYSYNAPSDASVAISSSCPSGKSQYYVLKTRLENVNDPDSCKNKLYQRCGDTGTSSYWSCASGSTPATNQGWYILTSQ